MLTPSGLENEIREAVPLLLDLARQSCRNKIAENCRFLLTEINQLTDLSFHERKRFRKINDRKKPDNLDGILLRLKAIYEDLYDIHLFVYRSDKKQTIIDIRYYRKSFLEPAYRKTVTDAAPMLHCKIAQPPWLTTKNEKFDINWEHREWLISWNLFKARFKQKLRIN